MPGGVMETPIKDKAEDLTFIQHLLSTYIAEAVGLNTKRFTVELSVHIL